MTKNGVIYTILGVVSAGLFLSLFWVWPQYRLWQREMVGKAELAEARWNRQIAVEEAQAALESERLNAQAEVERAKGAAEAIKIEGGSLTENYIKYLWVRQLNTGEKQLIYVPTEAGLPILEANRRNENQAQKPREESVKGIKFGDTVMAGLTPGVVIDVEKKRKWTYYAVVFTDATFTSNDFCDNLVEYEIVREDKIKLAKTHG